jgi:FkbM family methyltransferase
LTLGAASALYNLGKVIATHPLTRDRRLAAWSRFAGWMVSSRLNRELTVPWIDGQRLIVRRGMTGATGNVYLGLLEFMSMMLTLHFLHEDDLFFDIGANVGTYTVLASGVCRATTWAFEPDEQAGRDLARNVEINGLGDRVTIHAVALGPSDGEVAFTLGAGAMNRVAAAEDRQSRVVIQRRLDSVAAGRGPAMIKLDVEGYEEQVLQGATGTLAHPALKLVALEGTTPAILQLLGDNGFERAFYNPFMRQLTRAPDDLAYEAGVWTLSNEFYVRDWQFVAARLLSARRLVIDGRSL